jgi:hypothetical protein
MKFILKEEIHYVMKHSVLSKAFFNTHKTFKIQENSFHLDSYKWCLTIRKGHIFGCYHNW